MSEPLATEDFEVLLRRALRPVEPPPDFKNRLEQALTNLTVLAAEELERWEMGAMRDPRNWVRPVAAAAVDELAEWDPSALRDPRRWARFVVAGVVGASAGGALVLVRARQNQKRREARGLAALQKGMRSVRSDVQRRLSR